MSTLVSVNVGLPRDVQWHGRTAYTGIWKRPVSGARMVRRLNVDGDGQGDLAGHGGEQRAVLAYQVQTYRYWREQLHRDDLGYGRFGENFTVDGLADHEVCIGDRYRIGGAEFEVTQPRVTCFRLGMRLGEPTMPSLLVAHRRPGFYLRVLTEGHVEAGDRIVRTTRGRHAISVADIDALLYLPGRDVELLRRAVDVPALSPGWHDSFQAMLDAVERGEPVDAPSAGVEPGWSGFRPLQVTKLVRESSTVQSIHLTPRDAAALPVAEPGQFLTIRAPGAGSPAPVRSYSLSGRASTDSYRISVKKDGLVSSYLHTALTPGATLDAAAPRGEFVLSDDERPVLLISAGIGVTPVLAMLHQLADGRSERETWWLHTARSSEEHAFAEEARSLLDLLPRARTHVRYTAPLVPPDPASGIAVGRLTADALDALKLPTDASAYICGPTSFMSNVRDALVATGLAPANVHTELFGALPAVNPGIVGEHATDPHPPLGAPGAGPDITFARSGLTAAWSSEYRSVLELAEACDVPVRWSCRTGVCHTCATDVLAGYGDYTSRPLEDPPAGQALICCLTPRTDLVLDL